MSPLVILVAQVFVVVLFTGLCLVFDRRSVPAGVGLIVVAFTLMPLLMVAMSSPGRGSSHVRISSWASPSS
ncbi:hypothetical protein [Frigoribacterium sp. CFBP 13707]|uniref:hypothetical protein n=1 Tax=Frigoribacterium sp. CFBP 13707 TaxID=2775313 RepID=UPI0017814D6F|nr:hypothetical protein [Frigoribacterium sp. CFBP 13707]MBD8728879.1 hypothetical protein [Frigoribacterium sp. CFBP 13707]